jgi:hypothetical protein
MRLRRCAVLFIEARESVAFDLGVLLRGGAGLSRRSVWVALAPHLDHEVESITPTCRRSVQSVRLNGSSKRSS